MNSKTPSRDFQRHIQYTFQGNRMYCNRCQPKSRRNYQIRTWGQKGGHLLDIKDDVVVVKVVGDVAAGTWQIRHGLRVRISSQYVGRYRAPVGCGGCSLLDIRGDTIGIEIPNTNP
jgi:hypothetical protein